MATSTASSPRSYAPELRQPCPYPASLLQGEILLETTAHTAWGAAVTAQMYLPIERENVWQQLVDYPRWVHYFPDISQSRVVETNTAAEASSRLVKRLYQVASKTFLFLTAQVEIYLQVVEIPHQEIQFRFESGNFTDFFADLWLKDYANGTVLTYFVQATPTIPIPSVFIQQAIHLDLPSNLRKMRQVICS